MTFIYAQKRSKARFNAAKKTDNLRFAEIKDLNLLILNKRKASPFPERLFFFI